MVGKPFGRSLKGRASFVDLRPMHGSRFRLQDLVLGRKDRRDCERQREVSHQSGQWTRRSPW